MRALARSSLYYLLRYPLSRADLEHPWLFARINEVQRDPDGHLDLWFREAGKSSVITIGLTIFEILRSYGAEDPDLKDPLAGKELTFGLFSHSRAISKSLLMPIRMVFEQNESVRWLFPDICWAKPDKDAPAGGWTSDAIVLKRRSHRREKTVEAWGLVDSQPTGLHFDRLVFDDVITEKSVNTEGMIEKTTQQWRLALNLGRRGGAVRYIGTRYNYFDTYREILESKAAIPRVYPATVDGTPDGEPVLLSREVLDEKYRTMGPFVFSAQMLLDPRAANTQAFEEEWIQYYDGTNDGKGLNKIILMDPAGEGAYKRSDYSSIWVIGLGADRNFYVLDMLRDRISLTARTDKLFQMVHRWKPYDCLVESYGIMTDIPHIEHVQREKNYRFPITKVGGTRVSKMDRIRRLIPLFEAKRFWFPRSFSYTQVDGKTVDLVQVFREEEYKPFPVGRHPDMIDSLSRLTEPDIDLRWPELEAKPDLYKRHRPIRRRSWMSA
jgi:hypothetical protein